MNVYPANRHGSELRRGKTSVETGHRSERPLILLTNHHLRRGGGHDSYVETILQSDLSQLFELHVSSPSGSRLEDLTSSLGFRHWPCRLQIDPRRPLLAARSLNRFRQVVRQLDPDLVHASGGHDTWMAAAARGLSQTGYVLVRTHHATDPIPRTIGNRLLYDHLVQMNLFVSRAQFEDSTSRSNLRPRSWDVIPNGVDTERFSPREPDPDLRRRLGLTSEDFVVGSIAGTASYKRVDLALRTLSMYAASDPVKLCVLGKESTAGPLRRLAAELDVSDRFIHAGFQDDVRPYVALFDLGFVLSDRIESCSIATREMMAMGVPVVSSDFPGSRENIEDGREGFIVTRGSAEEFKEAIDRVRGMSESERTKLSRRARSRAVSSFGVDRQVAGIADTWLTLMRRQEV